MKLIALFVLLLLVQLFSIQSHAGLSAVRAPDQDYRDVAAGHRLSVRSLESEILGETDAYSIRSSDFQYNSVADWSGGDIRQAFREIRDERFMEDSENFARRPTWLYPYDGCYARAEVTAQRLEQKGFAKPSKVFIFGNLVVKTPNAQDMVAWWYHVAVAYRYQGTVYIFDPALSPDEMISIDDWSNMMGADPKEYSVCDDATFDPESTCKGATQISFEHSKEEQSYFFDLEVEHLLGLGRDPKKELADEAPWMKNGLRAIP